MLRVRDWIPWSLLQLLDSWRRLSLRILFLVSRLPCKVWLPRPRSSSLHLCRSPFLHWWGRTPASVPEKSDCMPWNHDEMELCLRGRHSGVHALAVRRRAGSWRRRSAFPWRTRTQPAEQRRNVLKVPTRGIDAVWRRVVLARRLEEHEQAVLLCRWHGHRTSTRCWSPDGNQRLGMHPAACRTGRLLRRPKSQSSRLWSSEAMASPPVVQWSNKDQRQSIQVQLEQEQNRTTFAGSLCGP